MRFLLIGLVILISLNSKAQDIVLDKDSLSSLPTKDTIYTISFTIRGTTMGEVPEVIIKDNKGSAVKDIDYALIGGDSTTMDSLDIRGKNKTGKLFISVAGGLAQVKSVQLTVAIKDKNVSATLQKSIGLRPWAKPVAKPAAKGAGQAKPAG